jgi:hypothetical protein
MVFTDPTTRTGVNMGKSDEKVGNWLADMKLFCQELDMYVKTNPKHLACKTFPRRTEGVDYSHLQRMSLDCEYVNNIDNKKYNAQIFEVQSMGRKILKRIGQNPQITFRPQTTEPPFFEKTLLIAISLAVEHQMLSDITVSQTLQNAAK